jgi:hypothetical protein
VYFFTRRPANNVVPLAAISTAHETLLQPAADSLCSTQVLHLRVLQYYVRAGDVLLFKSRGVVSSLLRSVTGSEWDHVAVVVPRARDGDRKGLLLLEATGDGVTALSLVSSNGLGLVKSMANNF